MKKLIFLTAIFVFFAMHANAQNLIKNGNFSIITGNLPSEWRMDSYQKDEGVHFEVIPQEKALKLSAKQDNHVYALQEVKVEKGKNYRFSAKVKTEGVGENGNGALLSLYYMIAYSEEVKGTSDYREVELYFSSDTATVPVILSLGGYGKMNSGTAYFKDVEINEVASVPQGAKFYKKTAEKAPVSTPKKENKGFDYAWVYLSVFLAATLAACFYYVYKK